MWRSRTWQFVVGSLVVHAGLWATAAWAPRVAPRKPDAVIVEVVAARSTPRPALRAVSDAPRVSAAPVVATAPPLAVRAARAAVSSAPVRETTVRLPPPPDDDDDDARAAGAFGVPRDGLPLGLDQAPPSPPPPPLVVEAEKHTAFIDAGFAKLSVLVQQWRHNDGVTRCLEQVVAASADVRDGGAAAQRRLYAAIDRGDQAAATAEARRLSDGARSFEALYQRARKCVTR